MKLEISEIIFYDNDKNGNPLVIATGKNAGKHYQSVRVKGNCELGAITVSGFSFAHNDQFHGLKDGDIVNWDIEKVEKDGKTYYNIAKPKSKNVDLADFLALRARVDKIENFLMSPNDPETIEQDDIPF